jgi:superfamily II DNA or RNA helicase
MLNSSVSLEATQNLILVEDDEQLAQLMLHKQPGLQDLDSYQWFLRRTQEGYTKYLLNNPIADVRAYQYQYAAVMCCRRYNMMGWQQRVGKTLSCLLVLYGLYKEKLDVMRAKSVHISVPSILASMSWVTELKRMPVFRDKFAVVTSDKELKETLAPIIIYSHDFPKGKVRGKSYQRSKVLAKLRPNMLIVDEIHGLKAKSLRTQHMMIVRNSSRRVLGLTGTPSEGTLNEIHTLMNFIYESRWAYRKAEHFVNQFGTKEKLTANYLYGSQHQQGAPEKFLQQLDVNKMPEYYRLMQSFMHRVNISDPEVESCITVPETQALMHVVTPTAAQLRDQQTYIAEHRLQLERAANAKGARQQAEALQLINPLINLANQWIEDNTSPKLQSVLDIVDKAEGKVVIFCQRVKSAWLVTEALRRHLGVDKVTRVYAKDEAEEIVELSQEQRIERVTAFQYDDNVKAGVFSINLASEAIELNQASDVIFYCLPWSSIRIRQAISRPVGPGNPYELVKLHYLYHKGFIDEYQVMLAVSKIKTSRALADYDIEVTSDSDLSPTDAIRKLLS